MIKQITFFLLSLLIIFNCQAQQLNLSLNLTKGNTYYLNANSNSEVDEVVNNQHNKVTSNVSYKMAFKILAIQDSIYTMDVSYQALTMQIIAGGKTILIDTKNANKQDATSAILASVINKPFTVLMTKSGKVKQVKNIEDIITNAVALYPQFDDAKKAQVRAQLLQTYGGNALRGNLELQTGIFPNDPINPKATWAVDTKLQNKFLLNVHTQYKLAATGPNFYTINGNGKINTDANPKQDKINGIPVKYRLAGQAHSTIKVDKKTGWIMEGSSKQSMSGNAEIMDNPKVPGGANLPLSYTSDIKTTNR